MSEKRLLTRPDGIFRKNLFHLYRYYQTTFQSGKSISVGQLVLMGSENDTVFGSPQAWLFEGSIIRLTSDSFDKISLHYTVNTIFLFTTQSWFWKTNLNLSHFERLLKITFFEVFSKELFECPKNTNFYDLKAASTFPCTMIPLKVRAHITRSFLFFKNFQKTFELTQKIENLVKTQKSLDFIVENWKYISTKPKMW